MLFKMVENDQWGYIFSRHAGIVPDFEFLLKLNGSE